MRYERNRSGRESKRTTNLNNNMRGCDSIAKNIKHQIQQAINNNFIENIDKHAAKHQDHQEEHTQIYSYSEKFRLLDTAKMLQNYIKDKGLNVKEIKNITPGLIQQFLNNKSSKCTQNTINND